MDGERRGGDRLYSIQRHFIFVCVLEFEVERLIISSYHLWYRTRVEGLDYTTHVISSNPESC